MPSNLTRRSLLAMAAATVALPKAAFALTESTARTLVDKVVRDINTVISSGKSLSGMIGDFERIFSRYADVNIIARSALGADARRASPAQMRAFTEAFRGYIARKYGKRFEEFRGGNVEVKSVGKLKTWYDVKATVYLRGSSPFEVSFYVSDASGKDLFFDMILEGISLRLSERTEIGAMLDRRRGDIDAMIADLRKAG